MSTSEEATNRMRAVRRRNTTPELAIRSQLHQHGFRFNVDKSPIKGSRRRADIVFPKLRVAIYVDGCFWHSCPIHGSQPKTNAEFWRDKLARNHARDQETDQELIRSDWIPIRVWEHEDPIAAVKRIEETIGERRQELHRGRDSRND